MCYVITEAKSVSFVRSCIYATSLRNVLLSQGSMFVSHPPNAYDLFLTAAVGDGIKLWDLRTNRCVRRYDGHVNRSQPVGVAISPCARFIATGSEDRSVRLLINSV